MELTGILERINERRGALGISESALSLLAGSRDMIRNWRRSVETGSPQHPKHESLARIAEGLNVSPQWLIYGDDAASQPAGHKRAPAGFHDTAVAYTFRESGQARTDSPSPVLAALYGDRVATPATFQVVADLSAFALLPRDVVVVEMARLPVPGELAIITIFDSSTASSISTIRRYMPPYLLAGSATDPDQIMRVDHPGVTVRYPVVGSVRGLIE